MRLSQRPLAVLAFALTYLLSLCAAADASKRFSLASSVQDDGMVHANDALLARVFKQKREYSVVLMLTTETRRFNCPFCEVLGPVMRLVAKNWNEQHPKQIDAGKYDNREELYFILADIDSCPGAFEALGLTTAPIIKLFPATEDSERAGIATEHSTLEFQQPTQREEHIVQWLNSQGFNVHIKKPFPWHKVYGLVSTIAIVAISTYFFWNQLRQLIQSKQLWIAVTIMLILLFVCGHMFNIIRGTPLVGWDHGQVRLFERGFTTQYGVETQIMAVLYAITSFSVICLIAKAPRLSDPQQQTVLVFILLFLLYLGNGQIMECFRMKTGSYLFRLLPFSLI